MKKLIFALTIPALVFFNSCGDASDDFDETHQEGEKVMKNPILKETIQVDITSYGLPLMITIPDTMNQPMDITVQDWGETEIRVGRNFQIKIAEGGDIELRKADLNDDLLYTDLKFLDDEPTTLRYTQGKKDDEHFATRHHFYLVKNIDGIAYEIQDIIGENNFPEASIKLMFEASKAIEKSALVQ